MRRNLQQARKAKGYTQERMAEELQRPHKFLFDGNLVVFADGTVLKKCKHFGWREAGTNQRQRYKAVAMNFGGKNKNYLIHRLVAEAFIPNPDHLPQVNHIDGNTHNNAVANLEWCTCQQNIVDSYKRHAPRYMTVLKKLRQARGFTTIAAAREIGILLGRYRDIENAVEPPDDKTKAALEDVYNVRTEMLFREYVGG